ncbi:MAG: ABC transporter permease [Ilumatobacteraceae bacterium]
MRNWVGWVFVALLTALALTSVGGAVAVARQTSNAFPRLLDAVDAADLSIGIGNPDYPEQGPIAPAELAGLDGIAEMRVLRFIFGTEIDDAGQPDETFRTPIAAAVEGAPAFPLQRGRWAATDSLDEVAISVDAVDNLGADLGDTFQFFIGTLDGEEITEVTVVDLVVVGVFGPAELNGPVDAPTSTSMIVASGAFLDAHPRTGLYQSASIWLSDDTTVDSFIRSVEDRFGVVDVETRAQDESKVQRAVQPEAYAVLGLGVAAALAGLIISALSVARQMNDGSDELSYVALGLTRRQRAIQRWAQALVAIAAGTLLGLIGSTAVATGFGAIGIADAFDRSTLEAFDLALAWGAGLVVTLVLVVFAAASSWMRSGISRQLPRTAPPAWFTAMIGAAPMEVRTGIALAGRGTGAHRAVRAAVVGTATSVAISVGVITFAYSLDALVSTPAMYGSNYDLSTWDSYGLVDDDIITSALDADSDIAEISRTAGSTGTINGSEVGLIGFDNFAVGPLLTSGRKPIASDEVVLGRRLAQRLDVGVGEDVTVAVGASSATYRVVGLGVLPEGVGDNAAFTLEGVQRIAPSAEIGSQYVRLREGANPDEVVERYEQALGCDPGRCEITSPSPPTDVSYLNRVGNFPRWSVAAVVLLGIVLSLHALLIVGRRSRRAIAILRSVGATRRQVTRFLLSQAMLIVMIAVALGVTAGVFIGRFVWGLFADELGVVPLATYSPAAIAATVAALMIITTAASAVPAWRSASRSVAPDLRTD